MYQRHQRRQIPGLTFLSLHQGSGLLAECPFLGKLGINLLGLGDDDPSVYNPVNIIVILFNFFLVSCGVILLRDCRELFISSDYFSCNIYIWSWTLITTHVFMFYSHIYHLAFTSYILVMTLLHCLLSINRTGYRFLIYDMHCLFFMYIVVVLQIEEEWIYIFLGHKTILSP